MLISGARALPHVPLPLPFWIQERCTQGVCLFFICFVVTSLSTVSLKTDDKNFSYSPCVQSIIVEWTFVSGWQGTAKLWSLKWLERVILR